MAGAEELFNNLWVLISGALVFTMTISVGLLEIGELGEDHKRSLLKTMLITCSAFFFMALVGFNTAFAPTLNGLIGNPTYNGPFLGGFSSDAYNIFKGVWWSMSPNYFNTGITLPTYFFFEAAFASVTLALVGVVVLRKVKLEAFFLFSIVYFTILWNLPAAWIWNPTGWLYNIGVRDFAGGLVVHGAAGAAGFGIVLQIWKEEKKRGFKESLAVSLNPRPGWLALSIVLLWLGWFGFNPGSTLALNLEAQIVVLTTFLAASSAFLSTMFFRYLMVKENPGLIYAVNGILMGLIVVTPLAGFVSPASAVVLGLIAGPLFLLAEKWFSRFKWFSDPVGLFPGHMMGGLFGISMIALFTQQPFAVSAGVPNLPNGILFGGGYPALQQLGTELVGVAAVMLTVFVLSYVSMWVISLILHGITTNYKKENLKTNEAAE
jgi:Amt family ammonium transporter